MWRAQKTCADSWEMFFLESTLGHLWFEILNFMRRGAAEPVSIHHLLFLVLSMWNGSTNPSEPALIYFWQLTEI